MTSPIDDSALLHGGTYDPVKAHEYYMRTRKLKGRRRAAIKYPGVGSTGRPVVAQPQMTLAAQPKKASSQRQKELQAQRDALEKRLERLKEALRQLVDAAKKRSGVEDTTESSSSSKSSKNTSSKKETLSTSEKKEKAKKAREEYQKEKKDPSVSQEIEALQKQIKDIRAKIESAIQEARRDSKGSGVSLSNTPNKRRSGVSLSNTPNKRRSNVTLSNAQSQTASKGR